ncbi:calcium-independent phospholipase A2-gamma-like [Dreissena polymorpha]|uniref:PNPLA domain-containing protein n=1 Tax=Dreissena polymorpha TaxID=45954 RepID=A0A9D4JQ49_DREPO|nr:calcium-independent phospholipase A2-gamma-like [Dreissena polymorpha]KAH3816798.1 hypothetical protein DPMN_118321 [Dreissena polymorpha]
MAAITKKDFLMRNGFIVSKIRYSHYCSGVRRKHLASYRGVYLKFQRNMGALKSKSNTWTKLRYSMSNTISGYQEYLGHMSKNFRRQGKVAHSVAVQTVSVDGAENFNVQAQCQSTDANDDSLDAKITAEVKNQRNNVENKIQDIKDTVKIVKDRIADKNGDESNEHPEWVKRILETGELNLDDSNFLKSIAVEQSRPNETSALSKTYSNSKLSSKVSLHGDHVSLAKGQKMGDLSQAKENDSNANTSEEPIDSNVNATTDALSEEILTKNESLENKTHLKANKKETNTPASLYSLSRIREGVTNWTRQNKTSSLNTHPQKGTSRSHLDSPQLPALAKKQDPKQTPQDSSYLNYVWNLPQNIQTSLGFSKPPAANPDADITRKTLEEMKSDTKLKERTTSLCDNLCNAQSALSKKQRLDDLCNHFLQNPSFRHIATQHKVYSVLLKMREESGNTELVARSNEALTLMGHVSPPKGHGIRMLSLDGGGTRGLIAIEMMIRLEQKAGRPIYELFDLVIGSSTGALLGVLAFMLRYPLKECRDLYIERSRLIFSKSSWTQQVKNFSQFDAIVFEEIVKQFVGEKPLTFFARNQHLPKMAITSCLANYNKWRRFMFRTYNLPPCMVADHEGTCNAKTWEAIRASGAAPIYFKEFKLGDYVFLDGGLLDNNPTHLGIHECKLLWPNEKFQCVVSLGNGRYDPYQRANKPDNSAWAALSGVPRGLLETATNTETVHRILKDTTAPGTYFRLCPYVTEDYNLAEVREEKVQQMRQETNAYIDNNEAYTRSIVDKLREERLTHQRLLDKASHWRMTHDYSLEWIKTAHIRPSKSS